MAKSSTSFKEGNKASVGNKGGRPREYDPLVEAEAILKWSKTPDATILRSFAPERGYAPSLMDQWLLSSPEFMGAYAIAKARVGARREKILIDAGSTKPFDRYADWYDEELLRHERANKAFEIELKAKIETLEKASEEDKARHDALLAQIKALQLAQEALKIDESSINREQKS
jgi:hypothetical protein